MLRWLPLFWVLSIPAVPLKPDPSQISTAEPPRRFDQSLEQLERSRVITPLERQGLEAGQPQAPLDVSRYQKACREGALSREECASGVAVRSLPRSRSASTPSSVPVSALLAGGAASFSLDSFFAVTPRPAPLPGNGDTRLLFPVIGQAITSSGFGWRLHPILGDWLMHAGRDFAAPQGTPVVAALSGRVVSSGLAGGYGIAIELERSAPRRRTLYGHLSELYVRAGQRVLQGDVIGRVGSTGLSTGPHLHFELRQPSNGGWQAVDPGTLDLAPPPSVQDDPVSVLMAAVLRSLQRT
ncbi:peptidase M23 family protein [Synechococcus sp. BOUM118]|nr:peptidase M23 family protein [Synechococcus sp. BOUM118]